MGEPKEHGTDLLGLVLDEVGSLFSLLVLLEHHFPVWREGGGEWGGHGFSNALALCYKIKLQLRDSPNNLNPDFPSTMQV